MIVAWPMGWPIEWPIEWPMDDMHLAPLVAPWWPGMPGMPGMTPMPPPDFTNPELSELSELKIDSAELAETEVPWGLEKHENRCVNKKSIYI